MINAIPLTMPRLRWGGADRGVNGDEKMSYEIDDLAGLVPGLSEASRNFIREIARVKDAAVASPGVRKIVRPGWYFICINGILWKIERIDEKDSGCYGLWHLFDVTGGRLQSVDVYPALATAIEFAHVMSAPAPSKDEIRQDAERAMLDIEVIENNLLFASKCEGISEDAKEGLVGIAEIARNTLNSVGPELADEDDMHHVRSMRVALQSLAILEINGAIGDVERKLNGIMSDIEENRNRHARYCWACHRMSDEVDELLKAGVRVGMPGFGRKGQQKKFASLVENEGRLLDMVYGLQEKSRKLHAERYALENSLYGLKRKKSEVSAIITG